MTGPDASVATASEIASAVSEKRISARAVIESVLARIKQVDPQTNAFTDVVTERALAKASALDEKISKGEKVGALAGVPFAVKNLFRYCRSADPRRFEDQPRARTGFARRCAGSAA